MALSTTTIVIMSIGSVLGVIFIIFLLNGGKYNEMIEPLNSKDFPFFEIYGVGFGILDLVKYNFGSKSERKRRQQIAFIYGDKHAEYYLRVNAAERVTLTFSLIVVGFAFYGLANDVLMLGVFGMFAFVAYYYVSTLPASLLEKKANAILGDFADVVSKMALLVNAGMIMKEAWTKVAYTGDTELYKEMQLAVVNMNNGVSEIDAYMEFGARCVAPEIKKFTSTIIQGLLKGNRELVDMIKAQSKELWDSKCNRIKQEGQKAASKLLIPICVMFVGILIMVIVPIFANMGM